MTIDEENQINIHKHFDCHFDTLRELSPNHQQANIRNPLKASSFLLIC